MISVAVEIPGLDDLLKDETRDIMRRIVTGTARGMVAKINEPKSGKVYKRGNLTAAFTKKRDKAGFKSYKTAKGNERHIVGSKIHRASAPGEAPANDSSNLSTSVTPILIDELRGEITMADYGLPLETGAEGTGRSRTGSIAARPFFEPSLDEVLQDL